MHIELVRRRNRDHSYVEASYDTANKTFSIDKIGSSNALPITFACSEEEGFNDVCIAFTTVTMANGRTRQCFYKIPKRLKATYLDKGYEIFYLKEKNYNFLLLGNDKTQPAFDPDIQESLSDAAASGFGDSGWMILTLLFSTVPFAQGGILSALDAWSFLGISFFAVPAIVGMVYPSILMSRYRNDFGHMPNSAEGFDIANKTISAVLKYALIDVGWTFSLLLLPVLFHSAGLTAAIFGGGPLGTLAFHAVSAVVAGAGAALGSYIWHVGKTLYSHFFTTPTFTKKFPFFSLNFHVKPKEEREPFSFVDVFIKPILTIAAPAFVSGMIWYCASLAPGAGAAVFKALPSVISVIPGASTIATIVGCGVAAVTAGLGSPVVAAVAKGISKAAEKVSGWVKGWFSKKPKNEVSSNQAELSVEAAPQPQPEHVNVVVQSQPWPVNGSQATITNRLSRPSKNSLQPSADSYTQASSNISSSSPSSVASFSTPKTFSRGTTPSRQSSLRDNSVFARNASSKPSSLIGNSVFAPSSSLPKTKGRRKHMPPTKFGSFDNISAQLNYGRK